MKSVSTILIVFSCLLATISLAQVKKTSFCSEKIRVNFQGRSVEMFDQLIKLGAVSLGDAGETNDWEKYLNRFRKFINYFDSAFTDQKLVNIVTQNKCPIVTCYAFHALVRSKGKRISDKALQDLLLPFAKDTTSYVYLDWGCSSSLIPMFDYLLSLVADNRQNPYLFGIKPLSKSTVKKILEERRPYFTGQDTYGEKQTWNDYCESFLK